MINTLRKHQQFLMVFVTILVIISFVWFYNVNRTAGRNAAAGGEEIASIYGRQLTQNQLERDFRRYYLAGELGLYEMIQSLRGAGQKTAEDFVWNSMVLEHEAGVLQIQPTKEEIIAEESHLPVFQTNGAFDPDKLAGFIQEQLAPKGFGESEIDELIVKDLQLKKVKKLLASTVALAPSEVRFAYDVENRKMDISVIRFRLADVPVKLSEDDLKKAFEARKDNFRSDEKRKVAFIVFSLPDSDKKLAGKDLNDAMGKLANHASDFAEAMTEKGARFDQVAAKFGLQTHETALFSEAEPDKQLAGNPAAVHAAFQMTKADPNSDPVQGPNSFYVMHLEDVAPSLPLTFEQARAQLTAQLKDERAKETLNLKATDIRNKIVTALKMGKSFPEAAKAAGQSVESRPPFSLSDLSSQEQPETGAFAETAMQLSPGELSEFTPSESGGALVFLDKFEPIDPAVFAKEEHSLGERFLRGKQEIAFRDWLRLQRLGARMHVLGQAGT